MLETSPIRATNERCLAGPWSPFDVQAAPSRVIDIRFCVAPDGFDSSNDTGVGVTIKIVVGIEDIDRARDPTLKTDRKTRRSREKAQICGFICRHNIE